MAREKNDLDIGEWLFLRASFAPWGGGWLYWKRRNRKVQYHAASGGWDFIGVIVHPLDTTEEITANLSAKIRAANSIIEWRENEQLRKAG